MSQTAPAPIYAAFDLLIGNRTSKGYLVTIIESPAGDGEAFCTIHMDAKRQDTLRALEQDPVDAHALADFGAFLFGALFTGDVATLYRTSLGMIRSQARRLRVRLRITAPELAALPWEYLFDPDEQSFLAISPETALVRYVPITLPVRPTTVRLPLRVLVVIASPHDLLQLDVVREEALLREALARRVEQGQIQVEVLTHANAPAISQAMRQFQPHVFHFVGHARFEDETASVALEDEAGYTQLVDERSFREFFSGSQETRLVLLNACQTATVSSRQLLVGLAPRLLQRQLSAVVAMRHGMSDKAAAILTREFYRCLALGLPVDAAISEARKGIFLEFGARSSAWGAPVLFLRAGDGLLFQVASLEAEPLAIPPPPELARPPEIPGFVGRDAHLAYYGEKLAEVHLAVIAGMPGVGKTALAAKLIERTARDRDRVFWHSFHEGEGVDAVLSRLAGFLARHGRDDLWRLLQSARMTGGKPPPSETLFDYVLQQVQGGGFLFCFDDFHHVDDDPVLNQLVERLRSALVAGELSIILTSRRAPDFVTLAQFDPLQGLSEADTRRLLTVRNVTLNDAQIEQLYQYTAGNAQFLTLAIDALHQTKDSASLVRRLAESEDIERYLLQEVDAVLTGQERGAMTALAILLGYGGTRDAIEAVLNGGNLFRTLRRLTERHLLFVRDGELGREYGQHAMFQAFYYEQTSVRERRALHHRAGEYYETAETDSLRASIHFERAGDYEHAAQLATGDVWAVINQGQARALRALLARFQREQLSTVTWVEVNLARGQIYSVLGEHEPASRSYHEALAQLTALTDGAKASALHAKICHGMGELLQLEAPQQALAWLQRGLANAAQDSPLETAALYIRYGFIQMKLGNYGEAQTAVEAGLERLPPGPSQLRVFGLTQMGSILSSQGQTSRGMGFTLQALAISRQLHDHFWTMLLLTNLAIDKLHIGDWQEAVDELKQGLNLAEQLGAHKQRASLEANLGEVAMYKGDFGAAEEYLEHGLALARQTHNRMLELYIHRCQAELHLRLTHWEVAAAELDRAESMAIAMQANVDLIYVYVLRADAALAKHQTDEALEHAQRAFELARKLGEGDALCEGLCSLGRIYLAIGRVDDALNAFEQSLAGLGEQSAYQAARTKMHLGIALISSHEVGRGVTLLQEVETVLHRLGAEYDLSAVRSVLSTLSLPEQSYHLG
ncbi:MAG: CHAT domain-containing protein [Caldilineaceae bacterium]|nr:CHAT domain-containing protein [Caldilineaceae bacterium]